MKKAKAGYTAPEVAVTVALLGLISLTVARTNRSLLVLGTISTDKQILGANAEAILNRLCFKIKRAGDGLQGGSAIAGKTLIAAPDNPLNNLSTEMIFLSRDQDGNGLVSSQDYWTRYSVGTSGGRMGVLERTYKSGDWLSIKAGTATLLKSSFIKMDSGVTLEYLHFTLYDSHHPPNIANQDPHAASAVRVAVHLKKGETRFERERVVQLENILYGPH